MGTMPEVTRGQEVGFSKKMFMEPLGVKGKQKNQFQTEFEEGNGMETSLEWKISRWPKKIYQWTPHGRRRRRRPQQSWKNQVTDFMRSRQLEEDMAEDRQLAFGSGWTALGCIDPNNKYIFECCCFVHLDLALYNVLYYQIHFAMQNLHLLEYIGVIS